MSYNRLTTAALFVSIALNQGYEKKTAIETVKTDFDLTENETVDFLALVETLKSPQSAILTLPST